MSISDLLKKAVSRAEELPKEEQDGLAEMLLLEIESEKKWDESFEKYPEKLAELGDEALKEFRNGKTFTLDLEAD